MMTNTLYKYVLNSAKQNVQCFRNVSFLEKEFRWSFVELKTETDEEEKNYIFQLIYLKSQSNTCC